MCIVKSHIPTLHPNSNPKSTPHYPHTNPKIPSSLSSSSSSCCSDSGRSVTIGNGSPPPQLHLSYIIIASDDWNPAISRRSSPLSPEIRGRAGVMAAAGKKGGNLWRHLSTSPRSFFFCGNVREGGKGREMQLRTAPLK